MTLETLHLAIEAARIDVPAPWCFDAYQISRAGNTVVEGNNALDIDRSRRPVLVRSDMHINRCYLHVFREPTNSNDLEDE
jgi:hypothetical protein